MNTARLAEQSGSGSILAVAVLAVILCLTSLLIPLASVLIVRQRVSAAADLAALAAADVVAGIAGGSPCEVAGTVARANGAALVSCELSGSVATVSTVRSAVGFRIVSVASAGPEPG